MSKGQIFSTDVILSIVAFSIVFIFMIALWNITSLRFNSKVTQEEMQLLTFQISDVLTKTPGIPSAWEYNPSNVSTIGLQVTSGKLDQNKIDALTTLDYTLLKKRYNIERFDIQIRILDDTGTTLTTVGVPTPSTATSTAVTTFMLVNNRTHQIITTLWKNK